MTESWNNRFRIGVNYWASHAGLFMWRRWDEDVVRNDLDILLAAGFRFLRVFPLWSDFQPIQMLRGIEGSPKEIRQGEHPLEYRDGEAPDGLDPEMMNRFDRLVTEAEARGITLNVSLLNGWMSGRLFTPPALEGKNPITDPEAIMWEVRFVRGFVRRYRDRPSIIGWDIGNETNCMGPATREQAWVWSNTIATTIRSEDAHTPVVSGMHGLDLDGPWRVQDQGELTDVMTTHPYGEFIPFGDNEGVDAFRSVLLPAAQSRYYGDIAAKPVLCQEINTLGPNFAAPGVMTSYSRTVGWLLWAYGVEGMMWWCAFDQNQITEAPYDWNALERELGLFSPGGAEKPVVAELTHLIKQTESIDRHLDLNRKDRVRDAVCILTAGQDHWAAAFSTFILAGQTGREVRFTGIDRPIPDSSVYLLPSADGYEVLPRRMWNELKQRVRDGAVLYVSTENAYFSEFAEVFGFQRVRRSRRNKPVSFRIPLIADTDVVLPFDSVFRSDYDAIEAEILGEETDGTPLLLRHRYGDGAVVYLAIPLEIQLAKTPGVFSLNFQESTPWWRVYELIFSTAEERTGEDRTERAFTRRHPALLTTEYPRGNNERIVLVINPLDRPIESSVAIRGGYDVAEAIRGKAPTVDTTGTGTIDVAKEDVTIFRLRRTNSRAEDVE